jgi:hypothetical protein
MYLRKLRYTMKSIVFWSSKRIVTQRHVWRASVNAHAQSMQQITYRLGTRVATHRSCNQTNRQCRHCRYNLKCWSIWLPIRNIVSRPTNTTSTNVIVNALSTHIELRHMLRTMLRTQFATCLSIPTVRLRRCQLT